MKEEEKLERIRNSGPPKGSRKEEKKQGSGVWWKLDFWQVFLRGTCGGKLRVKGRKAGGRCDQPSGEIKKRRRGKGWVDRGWSGEGLVKEREGAKQGVPARTGGTKKTRPKKRRNSRDKEKKNKLDKHGDNGLGQGITGSCVEPNACGGRSMNSGSERGTKGPGKVTKMETGVKERQTEYLWKQNWYQVVAGSAWDFWGGETGRTTWQKGKGEKKGSRGQRPSARKGKKNYKKGAGGESGGSGSLMKRAKG